MSYRKTTIRIRRRSFTERHADAIAGITLIIISACMFAAAPWWFQVIRASN